MPGRYRFPLPCRRLRQTRLEPREPQQKLGSHDLPVNSSRPAAPVMCRSGALGSACHHAGRAERAAQVPGLGLHEPAGGLAQCGRPASAASRMTSMSMRHANHGHPHVRLIGRNPVSLLLFSLPITYLCSILT
jgi:hypothetical protein